MRDRIFKKKKRNTHPFYPDVEIYTRPLIVHIMEHENLRKKWEATKVMDEFKISMLDYDKWICNLEAEREQGNDRW